jgi:hypothetical protein
MGFLEDEDQKYLDDVQAVKAWWKDSRWRYTKRPYTAEQIVAKRGNLKIQYPSNDQSKKLWKILESNFEVRMFEWSDRETALTLLPPEKSCQFHLWLSGTNNAHPNGQVPRHRLRFRLAELFHRLVHR